MSLSRLGRLGLGLAVLALCMLTLASAAFAQEGRYTMKVNGVTRAYYLFLPDPAPEGPEPLIIAFHGGGMEPDRFVVRTGLDKVADALGAVILAPEGLSDTWRYGGTMTRQARLFAGDDVAFVAALNSVVIPKLGTDPSRHFLVGVSAGGMMAYRIACERPGGINVAAVAAVASTMNVPDCPRAAGVALLHIHGDSDQNVPYDGGAGTESASGADYRPVDDGLFAFGDANGCTLEPPYAFAWSTSVTQDYSWVCPAGAEVDLRYVLGGVHTWFILPQEDTNATIAAFLARH